MVSYNLKEKKKRFEELDANALNRFQSFEPHIKLLAFRLFCGSERDILDSDQFNTREVDNEMVVE